VQNERYFFSSTSSLLGACFFGSSLLHKTFLSFRGVSSPGKDSETWSDRSVPLAIHALLSVVEVLHVVIGHLVPFLKGSVSPSGPNRQPGLDGSATKSMEQGVQTAQRLSGSIQAEE
jgi:hypothetical protein